jgi:hypothetical protein
MKVAPARARSTEVSFAFTIKARIEILSDSEWSHGFVRHIWLKN